MKKRLAAIVFFLFALIVSFIFVLWVWTDSSRAKKKAALDEYLKKCDVAISLKNVPLAKSLLINIDKDSIFTAEDWLRVEKRAFLLGELSGSYDVLTELGAEALSFFPGNLGIRLFLIEGYRREGYVRKAFEIARPYLSSYAGRSVLLHLWKDMVRSSPSAFSLAYVEKFSGLLPFLSDPDVYLDIAHRYDDAGMYMMSVLLMLRRGEMTKALSVLSSVSGNNLASALMVYLLYDVGAYSEVIEHSDSFLTVPSPERLLMVADSFFLSGQPLQGVRLYEHVINIVPEYSYLPYHNLIHYYDSIGDYDKAEAVLDDAFLRYGESIDLVSDKIRLMLITGKENAAQELAAKYGDNAFPALLLNVFASQSMGQDAVRSRLWELVRRYPHDERLIKYSAWFFTSHKMWDELSLLLEKSRAAFVERDWYVLFTTVLFSHEGKIKDAIRVLQEYDWNTSLYRSEAVYNLALLMGLDRRYKEALAYVSRESADISDKASLSRFMVLRAWLSLCSGDEATARELLDRALALQPDNFDAIILLRKFEK
ncbi:hypothetical protein WKV44_08245 [Spirochaetia bacterium 38H-sp]|uniref:Tetratricopeptide repeat protein n=1 Tax=Rarispira pelagica TaxID=3141764 RepID=A0ABU9UCY5_9SPIR